jgi:hypothetical protein
MKTGQSFQIDPSIMVRLAGIEPTTPWFVAKYSIQLSYSRTGAHLNTQIWAGRGGLAPNCNTNQLLKGRLEVHLHLSFLNNKHLDHRNPSVINQWQNL